MSLFWRQEKCGHRYRKIRLINPLGGLSRVFEERKVGTEIVAFCGPLMDRPSAAVVPPAIPPVQALALPAAGGGA
jgi:hypothetical protein